MGKRSSAYIGDEGMCEGGSLTIGCEESIGKRPDACLWSSRIDVVWRNDFSDGWLGGIFGGGGRIWGGWEVDGGSEGWEGDGRECGCLKRERM